MSQLSVISADNSLSIELHPDRWRLVHLDSANLGRVVFEAIVGEHPVTSADFASQRRLPVDGLPANAVTGVVLGWSPKLGAWQLGLVFTPEFAESRGSRWCELARWRDPDASLRGMAANRAAQSLARVLKHPLKVIPPRIEADEDAIAAAPPKPLPGLPLDFGTWKLEQEGNGLVFKLSGKWTRTRIGRIAWYSLWLIVFIVLSVLSLTVKLALPNAGTLLPVPQALPFMGLFVALVLGGLIIKNVLELVGQPNRVTVNPNARTVIAARGTATRWTMTAHHIEGVYVSEILGTRGRHLFSQYGELNLQLDKRNFRNVLITDNESDLGNHNGKRVETAVVPLTQNDVQSPLSAAAIYVAQALGGIPAWYDQRSG
ncbi:MAG: hypothetical protein KA401_01145 [Anaerolineae bacterium]|nr:hypothetical protein [Chloroflexota bacterium]MBP6297924.1 hypothetical protein [Anaerolineae bacterium]